MTVAEMQDEILKAGWQFQEHVFNDGLPDCSVQLSKSKNPHVFGLYPVDEATRKDREDNVGWGRFSRTHAWMQALEHVRKWEAKHAKGG